MFLNRIFKQGSGTGFVPKDSKAPEQADRGTYTMDNHTLIITPEQKRLIIKALEKFSQLQLGQTSLEQREAKKLEQLLARHKDSIVVDAVNSDTR
jgi:hypothetical protein